MPSSQTLTRHPADLYSTNVGFSYTLTSPKPRIIPDQVRAFDLPKLVDELTHRLHTHYMRWPEDLFAQSKPSLPECLFWLKVWGDDDLSAHKRKTEKLKSYRARELEEGATAELCKLHKRLCNKLNNTMYYNKKELELSTIVLLCAIPIEQAVSWCEEHLHKTPALEALLLLKQYDSVSPSEAARRVWQQTSRSVHYDNHENALRYALIIQDEALAIKLLDGFTNPGFELRSLAMKASRLITRWEDFERIFYKQLQVYSPLVLLAHLQNFGALHLELALEKIEQRWSSTWGGVFHIHHPAITTLAIKITTKTQKASDDNALRRNALKWLHREGANAIVGSLKLWEDAELGQGAQAVLKDYIARGHDALVLSLAQEHAPEHVEALKAWAQASPAPDATLPEGCQALEYWFKRGMRHPIPDGIMPPFPILTVHEQPLSPTQTEGLLRLLQDHKKARAQEDKARLEAALCYDSRLKLASHLLTRSHNALIPSERWFLEALAMLLPQGLEPLYPLHAARYDQRLKLYAQPRWAAYSQLGASWNRFMELMLTMPNPSHDALLARELILRTPHHRESPLIAQLQARLDARAQELGTAHLFTAIEASITQTKLPTAQRNALYHELVFGLKPQWTGRQWKANADALVAERAAIVWAIRSKTGGEERTFRLDYDGSTLDALERNVTISDDMLITYTSHSQLSERDARAWGRIFVEHELVAPRPQDELGFTKSLT